MLLSLFDHSDKPFDHFRILMREEGALRPVERVDPVDILPHAFGMDGFRNDDGSVLKIPSQNDLRRTLSVSFCDLDENRIFPSSYRFFECPPGRIIIRKRLVQQAQIQIVRLKLLQRFKHGLFRFLIAVMLHPDLGLARKMSSRGIPDFLIASPTSYSLK